MASQIEMGIITRDAGFFRWSIPPLQDVARKTSVVFLDYPVWLSQRSPLDFLWANSTPVSFDQSST